MYLFIQTHVLLVLFSLGILLIVLGEKIVFSLAIMWSTTRHLTNYKAYVTLKNFQGYVRTLT